MNRGFAVSQSPSPAVSRPLPVHRGVPEQDTRRGRPRRGGGAPTATPDGDRAARPGVAPPDRRRGSAPQPDAPRPPGRRSRRPRGRHVREQRLVRVGAALAAPDLEVVDDVLVLQVLRRHGTGDLDAAQVSARSALPPSVVASALDRLVRGGLARDLLVDGRVRYGLP